MEFRLLGPLEAVDGGRDVALPAGKPRALLALLLLELGQAVPVDRIVDALWCPQPPSTAAKVVQGYVSRLRKALGRECLETTANGYLLRSEPASLDVRRFEGLVGRGRALVADGRREEAVVVLDEALGIWRGPALVDFRDEAFAQNEIGRLEELRLVAVELRLEGVLALDRSAEAVGELEALVRSHPMREGLRGLLMLALYRSGRQADALAAYQETRTALVEELGLEPSRALQQLEQAILRQDESLDLEPAAAAARLVPAAHDNTTPERSATAPSGAARKVVTVLFCDVNGATPLGGQLDPEALRLVLATYFERASAVIERHGGSVERAIGDAMMAVFGIPVLHEDDALRAVRAASGLLAELPGLNDELERDIGTRLELRIGISTGEVIAGSDERLATGDAINVAAGLEQAADSGEVLIGPDTLTLTREAVTVNPAGELMLKGRARPVTAFRLVSVLPDSPRTARHLEVPIVGRVDERKRVEGAFGDAVARQGCRLVTLLGPAGVGKSRLAAEFLADLDARVVSGRCLSYGEGITYWPVTEVILQLGDARERLLEEIPAAVPAMNALFGLGSAATPGEIAWATRKLLESTAGNQPLVVVFDDIQWGEPIFLDLVEHVAGLSHGAPILILCLARPELLDHRPAWGSRPGELIRLELLDSSETRELIERLARDQPLEKALAARISAASAGNPLFVEEMVMMARESTSDDVVVPPTIKTLLATRIDQLDPAERGVLERGSVEGELFHRGAVEALASRPEPVLEQLLNLARKELIRPDLPQLPAEDAFRFRHLLIRDAAYEALPKAARATFHERFATWLGERGAELVERDEIVGYHLEQARRLLLELAPLDDRGRRLGHLAASRLEAAGHRAFARGDMRAAASLLGRSVGLLADAPRERLELLPDLGEALMEIGEFAEAQRYLGEAVTAATGVGDPVLQANAILTRLLVAHHTIRDLDTWRQEVQREVDRLTPLLDGDEAASVRAKLWRMVAFVHGTVSQWQAAAGALEQAIAAARIAGDSQRIARLSASYLYALCEGPTPVDVAIERAEEVLGLGLVDRQAEAIILLTIAPLHAMARRFDRARELAARGEELLKELGAAAIGARTSFAWARIELMAGNPGAAAHRLRADFDRLTEIDDNYVRPNIAALLAKTVFELGETGEAEALVSTADRIASPDDIDAQVVLQSVRARVMLARGQVTGARAAAAAATEQLRKTDAPVLRADALVDLSEALPESLGRRRAALEQARLLYEEKGHLVGLAQVDIRLTGSRAHPL
jgi:class 3 adenylate cyclase